MSMPRIQPLPTTKAGPDNPVHHINKGNEQEVLRRLQVVPVVGISDLFLPRPIIDAAEELDAPRLPRTDVIGVVKPHGCIYFAILQFCPAACCFRLVIVQSSQSTEKKACRSPPTNPPSHRSAARRRRLFHKERSCKVRIITKCMPALPRLGSGASAGWAQRDCS